MFLTASSANGASSRRNVLVLGDSLSAGFRLAPGEAWPELIAPRFRVIDRNFHVINASISGSSTIGGVQRLPRYLKSPVEIFVVELGINDAFRDALVEQIRANLERIIEMVQAKNPGVKIVVVGMQFPLEAQRDYVTAFGNLFGEVAAKYHAALVPYLLAGVAGNPSLNLPDFIHPNAAGHRILADTMWTTLAPFARMPVTRPARLPTTN